MRSLVPLASMLFALALPAAAQSEAQFRAWCFDRASNEQKIEGCSAIIAGRAESAENLFRAYNNRAAAYAMSGDYGRAIEDNNEALKLQPGEFVVWVSRCHVRAIVDDLQAALADCNEALRLAPSVPFVLETRGLVLLKLGRFDEAIADYDAGLKVHAKSAIGLYGRGVAKRRKGDVAGSDADFAAARAIRSDVGYLLAKWGVNAP